MILIILMSFLGLYFFFISWLIIGIFAQKKHQIIGFKPITFFTIIVPFRDEQLHLPNLLDSFSNLNYPKNLFEVILVDDQSETPFELGFFDFKIKIINNIRHSNSPKKDAISTAIHTISSDWIITTDADCLVLPDWLLLFDNCIQKQNVKMIVGAVKYKKEASFLGYFQQFEFASLQAATMGSFGIRQGFMCNAANFAYRKSFFQVLDGFVGNNHLASGDDVFLLQKALQKDSKAVFYIQNESNIVTTFATKSWRALWHQRLRWASKATAYRGWFGISLSIVVLGCNASFVAAFLEFVCKNNFDNWLLFCFFVKMLIDGLLVYFYEAKLFKMSIIYMIISSLTYPLFATSVAVFSFFVKFEWKNRRF